MTLTIYADGACLNNGYSNARGGWGVYSQAGSIDACGPLPGHPQTNNRAELYALQKAIELGLQRDSTLNIRTDSTYCVNIFGKWINKWQRTGWVDSDGHPVANQDLINQVNNLKQRGYVTIEHVPGHSGYYGNERANELAQLGAQGHRKG